MITRFKRHVKIEFDTMTEDELKDRLKADKKKYLPDLPDSNATAVIIKILNLVAAFITKYIRKFINYIANELFISTASSYEAVTIKSRDMGRVAGQEKPARVLLSLTLTNAITIALKVSKDSYKFYSQDCKDPFELEEDILFPAGSVAGTTLTGWAVQGTTVSDEILGESDGESLQRYESNRGYVIEDSTELRVSVDYDEIQAMLIGVTEETWQTWQLWEETKNLLLELWDAQRYEVDYYTQDGNVVILIGTGKDGEGHGLIPPENAELKMTYRILIGGQNGNVAAGTITRMSPTTAAFSVTNILPASGWIPREDLDVVRFEAPRKTRVNERTIKEDDYVNMAEEVDGIGRACAVRHGFDEGIIVLYLFDTDGNPCEIEKCLEVEAFIEGLNPGDETIKCIPGQYYEIIPSITAYLADGFDPIAKETEIRECLIAALSPIGIDSASNHTVYDGMVLYPDDFKKVLFGTDGVDGLITVDVNLGSPSVAIPSGKLPDISGMIIEVT